jgi:hypothetical protein
LAKTINFCDDLPALCVSGDGALVKLGKHRLRIARPRRDTPPPENATGGVPGHDTDP